MTLYETIFIVHPDQAGKAKEMTDTFKKLIEGLGATATQVEEWGMRDLAYRIRKQSRGYYNLLRYRAPAKAVEELERNLKLSEGVIRYLTVRLEEDVSAPAAPIARDSLHGDRRASEEGGIKVEPGS
ncbi:MAG: 30S ribosomal protein S6 [Candidatus Binatia bacterium]